jgi:hypothetical protein
MDQTSDIRHFASDSCAISLPKCVGAVSLCFSTSRWNDDTESNIRLGRSKSPKSSLPASEISNIEDKSMVSIPFIILHTVLFSQHKRRAGATIPHHPLHTACSYLPRAMIVLWLAAAVAGLLVVSKQPGCITEQGTYEFWQAGIGCNLHRTIVVIAVLTLYGIFKIHLVALC